MPKGDGDSNGRAKLSLEQGLSIAAALARGANIELLARKYGVTVTTIYEIKRGEHWTVRPVLTQKVSR